MVIFLYYLQQYRIQNNFKMNTVIKRYVCIYQFWIRVPGDQRTVMDHLISRMLNKVTTRCCGWFSLLTSLHSEWPKLQWILASLSAIGLLMFLSYENIGDKLPWQVHRGDKVRGCHSTVAPSTLIILVALNQCDIRCICDLLQNTEKRAPENRVMKMIQWEFPCFSR